MVVRKKRAQEKKPRRKKRAPVGVVRKSNPNLPVARTAMVALGNLAQFYLSEFVTAAREGGNPLVSKRQLMKTLTQIQEIHSGQKTSYDEEEDDYDEEE